MTTKEAVTTVSAKKSSLLNSLREIVFGLEDGIVSTLGAITGIATGTQNGVIVIMSGFVIIFVESLSMGAGTFLSNKSEHELNEKTVRELKERIVSEPDVMRKRLRLILEEREYTEAEVGIVLNRITSSTDLWAEEIAMKELHVIPAPQITHVKDGVYMAASYIIGGLIPLMAYIFLPLSYAVPISISASVVALFLLGYTKGRLVHINPVKSGAEMMAISIAAALVGYVVGRVASNLLGIEI